MGDWRGFILGRNWVYKLLHWEAWMCGISGSSFLHVFLMHSGHFQLEVERTILSSDLLSPKHLGWNHSGQK